MATIDIGKIKPVFKGTYDNSTAYVLDDIVYYNGSSYVAKTSTTGNLPTDTTKWNILASGSGGIWDSTLSLGSASQQLRVNSGASALEFYTPTPVSTDFVHLGTTTASNVSSINFDGLFTSDYDVYKIFFHNIYSASGGSDYYIKYREGGSTQTGSYVYHLNQEGYNNGGINSAGYTGAWPSGTADYIRINGDAINTTANHHAVGHVEIFNPLDASAWKGIKGYTHFVTTNKMLHCNFFGRRNSTTAMSGIEFSASGNFYGKFHLYGMKNS